ncbi:penicillin-binding protein [Streptomyces sp. APSN-46.1]|uniref:penicillin-binding transpeptidase domain-containing protein n=1 Tax=Streptomyces sp. APSN-46.1 TaxID=2929049 RepID=UPI001FB44285|nr:penicillin-binding transpeptidase domain-containing protein [Streptomyces sp. APSN-46.1]MCJ1676258.1 penicillin-binding protein [Streptomyces sp. APSN-46.1]
MPAFSRRSGVALTALFALLAGISGCTAVQREPTDSRPSVSRRATGQTPDAKPRSPRTDGSPGDILVAGRPITGSKATGHPVAPFQRTYTDGELYSSVTGYWSMAFGKAGLDSVMADDVQAGKDVPTTIDPGMQRAAFDGLRDKRGAAFVLDAETGAILGQVSTPSFDPGAFSGNSGADARAWEALKDVDDGPLRNRALREVVNPGPAIHVLVAAAALEKGLLASVDTPTNNPAVYIVPGSTTQFSGDPAHCTNATLRAALRYSCENVFAHIASDLGADALASTAEEAGFNHDTMDTPVRAFESTWPRKPQNATQLALAAGGLSDVKATPMQMAMVTALISNGGLRVHPRIVTDTKSPMPPHRALSERTADQLQSALGNSFSAWVPSASVSWALSATRTPAGRPVAIAVYITSPTDATAQASQVAQRVAVSSDPDGQ